MQSWIVSIRASHPHRETGYIVSFWKRIRSSKAKIEAVAMDMSPAYRGAVSTHLPNAKIVFDRFHVVKLFNEKLPTLRAHRDR